MTLGVVAEIPRELQEAHRLDTSCGQDVGRRSNAETGIRSAGIKGGTVDFDDVILGIRGMDGERMRIKQHADVGSGLQQRPALRLELIDSRLQLGVPDEVLQVVAGL